MIKKEKTRTKIVTSNQCRAFPLECCHSILGTEYIMALCLLDLSDADYYEASKCVILKKILEDKLKEPCEPRLRELYGILYRYVQRAIDLGTGVVIEL